MQPRFSALAALAVTGLALAAPTAAEAAPLIQVALATPAIVATTPHISVSIGNHHRPGPNWVWVAGDWSTNHHGHSTWVDGYWNWSPPAHPVVTVHRSHHVGHHRPVHTTRRVSHHR